MTLKQDQKDFPHIAQDIQVAIDHENKMTNEQELDMTGNIFDFQQEYAEKYRAGQKSHGGNMWEMGAYQTLQNAKDEVLDQWSYLMTLEKILGEIKNLREYDASEVIGGGWIHADDVYEILNRRKED